MLKEKWTQMGRRLKVLWGLGGGIILLGMMYLILTLAIPYSENRKSTGWEGITLYRSDSREVAPWDITFDNSGQAWVGTYNGVYTYDGNEWLEHSSRYPDSPQSNVIDIKIDPKGLIWVSGIHALYTYDGFDWESFPLPEKGAITTIAFDHMNRVWGGTDHLGFYILDDHVWISYTQGNSPLASNNVNKIIFDQDGNAWIGTEHGLQMINGADPDHTENWSTYNTSNSDIPGNGIDELVIDNTGLIWVGGNKEEISTFDGEEWNIHSVGYDDTGFSSSTYIEHMHAMVFDSNERLYVLPRWDMWVYSDGELHTYDDDNSGIGFINHDIAFDPDGNPWITGSEGIQVAVLDDSGLPPRLSERAVNITFILRISRSVTILFGIVLILTLGFVYIGKIVIPVAALMVAGLISVILGGTSFELVSSLFIPIAGCSLLGGLVGGLLRRGQKSQILYSIFLSIAGAVLGAVLIMSLMSM